jgi:hypothetical protein
MSQTPTRRTVLKSSLAAAVVAAIPTAMAAELTTQDLTKGFAKPLSPENQKLAEAALKDVKDTSASRVKHVLPENSEPSFVFQVRPGATTKW